MKKNVIVGQSGGPTAAINSSLAGVYRAAVDCGAARVYGMVHGIKGLLEERVIDLAGHIQDNLDEELLKRTPAAYLGSCRYKLPEIQEDEALYEKIFTILDKLEVEAFIYIGGNDSMDTIKKLSDYAVLKGRKIRFVGCPKTIDNDLALTDHTPGYGSASKYIGTSVKELIRDSHCIDYPKGLVTVVEIMGRDAGWLTGAAVLAKGEDCQGPDLIYLPEVPFDVADFIERVKALVKSNTAVVAAVSEGIRDKDGTYISSMGAAVSYTDAFGHQQLTGTATYLCGVIASEAGCKTRAVELSALQRAAAHLTSRVDILEAYQAGGAAVTAADKGETGKMVIIERLSDHPYQSGFSVRDVHKIANDVKTVPRSWINREGNYVTDAFADYVRPLIQGEVPPIMVDGIPRYLYKAGKKF